LITVKRKHYGDNHRALMSVAALGCLLLAGSVPRARCGETPTKAEGTPAKAEALGNPPAATLRLYVGQVISSTEAGAIVDCKGPAAGGQLKGADPSAVTGRFYLRGTPELLAPSAEIQFLATDDGTHRYVDFFKTVSTMRALRFVKWEKPAAVVAPTPQSVAAQPSPTPKPRSTNPTPNLRGTMLDRPPQRLGR
jgi:hypothetical protein